ncbi:MAG: hypothetical protein JXB26_13585 [Candidatus Aminicenantes bacterium]|nr:hypothetical protein [Candidatus Aminicenantes bacterium]
MIEAEEHYYDDDPANGHPDVRTRLKDAAYFFLGNGTIMAAVQVSLSGEGTPLGLLVMNPERLGKKREALTFDPVTGLESTQIHIFGNGTFYDGYNFRSLETLWEERNGNPAVKMIWSWEGLEKTERFFCPDKSEPLLFREVHLKNTFEKTARFSVKTGIRNFFLERELTVKPEETVSLLIRYGLKENGRSVDVDFFPSAKEKTRTGAIEYPAIAASFSIPILDRMFDAARFQLPAVISRSGKVDGSIWQYNREWVRDQAMMVIGLVGTGYQKKARIMLDRLLGDFVTEKGDTVDSGCLRDRDEVELDQNGELLIALREYILWSGDRTLLERHWEKIKAAAEFPLQPVFRHKASGLLANRREYWERHRIHGIEEGMEMVCQLFVSLGLAAAGEMARLVNRKEEALHWEREAVRLKKNMLEHPRFALMDARGFIKRKNIDGTVQEYIQPQTDAGLPEGVPLAGKGKHFLNPDASSVLPIAWNFVPADSLAAAFTLAQVEGLWNQAWKGGGYGRYHVSSEPDSPGPWPFASLFIARAAIETERFGTVWRILNWLDSLDSFGSGAFFEFYGERKSPPFPQVGIVPWTWAELLLLFIRHVMGIRPEPDCLQIRPRLLPGMSRLEAEIPFRQGKIRLDIKREPGIKSASFKTGGRVITMDEQGVRLEVRKENEIYSLEGVVP